MIRRPPSPRIALVVVLLFCHALAAAFNVACVKLPRRAQSADILTTTANATPQAAQSASDCATPCAMNATRVNINRATRAELMKLPGIGEGLAARIIAHRERYGAFRRIEHLMMVRGISERRFARLRHLIIVE